MKIFRLALALFLFPTSQLAAQGPITISKADMPVAGKFYTYSTAVPLQDLGLDNTGEGVYWDYSALQPLAQSADSFKSMSVLNPTYKIFFGFSQPNLALPGGIEGLDSVMPIPMIPTKMLTFYQSSNASYTVIGYGTELGSFPVGMPYSEADIVYHFPLSYGQMDSSHSEYEMSLPGMFFYNQKQWRRNYVDGWGHIKTPYGEWDALRVKTVLEQNDTLYVDTFKNGVRLYPVFVEYKWLAKGKGIPVLSISGNAIGGAFVPTDISYLDTAKTAPVPTSMAEQKDLGRGYAHVWPNPAKDRLHIAASSQVISVNIYDIRGKEVYRARPLGDIIDISSLKEGMYYVRVNARQGSFSSKLAKLD